MKPTNRYRVSVHQQAWWVLVEVDPDLLAAQLAGADPLELSYGITAETPAEEREAQLVMGTAHHAMNLMAIDGGTEFDESDDEQGLNWTLDALDRMAVRQLITDAPAIRVIAANVRLPRERDLSVWKLEGASDE